MLIFTLKGDDAPDSQVDSRVFGVAWWLLWPAFVFQLLSIFAAYAWVGPLDEISSGMSTYDQITLIIRGSRHPL